MEIKSRDEPNSSDTVRQPYLYLTNKPTKRIIIYHYPHETRCKAENDGTKLKNERTAGGGGEPIT